MCVCVNVIPSVFVHVYMKVTLVFDACASMFCVRLLLCLCFSMCVCGGMLGMLVMGGGYGSLTQDVGNLLA